MGQGNDKPDNLVCIHDVEANRIRYQYLVLDTAAIVGHEPCRRIVRAVVGPSLDGVRKWADRNPPETSGLSSQGCSRVGIGPLVWLNQDGGLDAAYERRFMLVSDSVQLLHPGVKDNVVPTRFSFADSFKSIPAKDQKALLDSLGECKGSFDEFMHGDKSTEAPPGEATTS